MNFLKEIVCEKSILKLIESFSSKYIDWRRVK